MDIFHAIFTLYFFLFAVYRAYYMGLVYSLGEKVDKWEEGVLVHRLRYWVGTPVIGGAFLYVMDPSWMAWSQIKGVPIGFRLVGVTLVGAACFIYCWTHIHLGKNFTDTVVVRKASKIVADGPYAYVRHPMYLSGIIASVGCFFLPGNWFLGTFGTLLMLLIMYVRTPIEEKKLLDRHGEEYREYMDKVSRFFPF